MTGRSRLLIGETSPSPEQERSKKESAASVNRVDSEFVVILASLICGVICLLGLIAVARCAWIRHFSAGQSPAANKGLKKKVLNSLPRLTYGAEEVKASANLSPDCPICLAGFAADEEIRVLPHCGHGFHVTCIDTWLSSHSSCPSCRQVLGAVRCHKCGGLPEHKCSPTSAADESAETQPEPREGHVSTSPVSPQLD